MLVMVKIKETEKVFKCSKEKYKDIVGMCMTKKTMKKGRLRDG